MQSTDYSFRKDLPVLTGPVQGCAVDTTITDTSALDVFPNGISFAEFDLNEKQRIPPEVLAVKINDLKQKKLIPDNMADVDNQIKIDSTFYTKVQSEYCWYENRYSYLLKRYLSLLMSSNQDDITLSTGMNGKVTLLNKRLQSLLEIMNSVSNERAQRVDTYRQHHTDGNDQINKNLKKLADVKEMLGRNNVRLTTQREMQHFTEEKNAALRNQVTFFAILNVLALGAVYTAYKNST